MTTDALLKHLEAATEGSRQLDGYVAYAIKPDEALMKEVGGQGISYANCVDAPHYTTSLDAALTWENIAHVHAPDWHGAQPPGRWQAAHDCGEGRAVYGYGSTEALARRIAALKAREAA